MKLLYIIKHGASRWEDNELRYSLRSVEQYGQNVEEIIICGHRPSWCTGVVHSTLPDPHLHKYDNTWFKMKSICSQMDAPFVLMNDDFFLLQPTDFNALPDYYDGNISEYAERFRRVSNYAGILYRTKHVLLQNGYPERNYAIHYPLTIHPLKIRQAFSLFEETPAISFRLLYGNIAAQNPVQLTDCKFNNPIQDIPARLQHQSMFSIGDGFLDENGKQFLANKYPQKSRYEK